MGHEVRLYIQTQKRRFCSAVERREGVGNGNTMKVTVGLLEKLEHVRGG